MPITFLLLDSFQISVTSIRSADIRYQLKVVRNSAKFFMFFALPNFVRGTLPKVVPALSRLLLVPSHGKVSWGYCH